MKRALLWSLRVTTYEATAEAVAELLGTTFGEQPVIYTDLEAKQTIVTVYLQSRPEWSKAARGRLTAALKALEGPLSGSGSFTTELKAIPPEDWAESWKRHFKPLEIGSKLLIRPSWSQRKRKKGQITVILDPGMSFGTGQHPTTHFCLQELVRARKPHAAQSLLDVGTGSGILAICAAKLGYQLVHALDVDADAIRIAKLNARANAVSPRIQFRRQDLASLRSTISGDQAWPSRASSKPKLAIPQGQGRYSVVCANLIADVLLAEKQRLVSLVSEGGVLVLAGILKEEFSAVQSAYEAAGVHLTRSQPKGEWRSGAFVR